jgi:hypothetical protein
MRITTAAEAKKHIRQRLYWDDISPRYNFLRSGILTDVFKTNLEFDEDQDFKSITSFTNLRTNK